MNEQANKMITEGFTKEEINKFIKEANDATSQQILDMDKINE